MAERDYTVTDQIPTRELRGGVLTDILEVHYTGPHDIKGWVRVPVATMSDEQVDAMVRQQLEKQLRIAMLGSR